MIQNRDQLATTSLHEVALECIEAGIAAAHPSRVMDSALERTGTKLQIDGSMLDLDAYARIYVVGGGKAAGQMAGALESVLDDRLTEGLVVTNDPVATDRITVIEGSHPTPDAAGNRGAKRVLSLAERADEDTLVLCLLSGGASALLPAPVTDVSLAELQALTEKLLASGASIDEINTVRKHLSTIKGGRLAEKAAPASVVSLVLSDVVGNDPSVIASGPTMPDRSTYTDALAVLDRYAISPAASIQQQFERGVDGDRAETPDENHPAFERTELHVLADGFTALTAARSVARAHGYTPIILSSQVEGEARETALTHVAIAEEAVETGNPVEPPAVFLSGGETTVTMTGDGIGGPNQEFVLSGAMNIGSDAIVVASVDTDGKDGAADVAGAIADSRRIDDRDRAERALTDNDSFSYLETVDAHITTGPTGTNVNDLRVLVVSENIELPDP